MFAALIYLLCLLQVSLFGPAAATNLHDSSARLWSGLLTTFYMPRWQSWSAEVLQAMLSGVTFDEAQFLTNITQWETGWTQQVTANLPTNATGDVYQLSRYIFSNYF